MSWSELVEERRVERRRTSREEIEAIRKAFRRALEDGETGLRVGLSPERCFNIAYDAARLVAVLAIRGAGYRVKAGPGAHYFTFRALRCALGGRVNRIADYLDQCRERRNAVSYDFAGASSAEAKELLERAKELSTAVEDWLAAQGSERPEE